MVRIFGPHGHPFEHFTHAAFERAAVQVLEGEVSFQCLEFFRVCGLARQPLLHLLYAVKSVDWRRVARDDQQCAVDRFAIGTLAGVFVGDHHQVGGFVFWCERRQL